MAVMTITTTSAQDAKIVVAFGKALGLRDVNGVPRNATGAEVKAATVDFIRQTVFADERKTAADAAIAPVVVIDPT